jgi:hypothetical protein
MSHPLCLDECAMNNPEVMFWAKTTDEGVPGISVRDHCLNVGCGRVHHHKQTGVSAQSLTASRLACSLPRPINSRTSSEGSLGHKGLRRGVPAADRQLEAGEMANTGAEPMPFYAHSKQRADGSPAPFHEWEPLFTPFAGQSGAGCQKRDCPQCESLDPDHGHLNKVAFWTARFAMEMFATPADREKAWHWGYIAGLWHDLGKFSSEFQGHAQP